MNHNHEEEVGQRELLQQQQQHQHVPKSQLLSTNSPRQWFDRVSSSVNKHGGDICEEIDDDAFSDLAAGTCPGTLATAASEDLNLRSTCLASESGADLSAGMIAAQRLYVSMGFDLQTAEFEGASVAAPHLLCEPLMSPACKTLKGNGSTGGSKYLGVCWCEIHCFQCMTTF
jgi:hypothetical protein